MTGPKGAISQQTAGPQFTGAAKSRLLRRPSGRFVMTGGGWEGGCKMDGGRDNGPGEESRRDVLDWKFIK